LVAEMKLLRRDTAKETGKGEGVHAAWVVLIGAVALIASLIAVGTFVFNSRPSTSPQVIYAPAPTVAQPPTTK